MADLAVFLQDGQHVLIKGRGSGGQDCARYQNGDDAKTEHRFSYDYREHIISLADVQSP
jgi:hypothetical protein